MEQTALRSQRYRSQLGLLTQDELSKIKEQEFEVQNVLWAR